MANKIIGYLLLTVGLIIIGWALFTSYDIFTGKASAPKIFFEYIKAPVTSPNSSDSQKQLEQAISDQLGNLIPPNSIPQIFNLVVWSMLVWILILGGGQISMLGIKLIAVKEESHDK